MKAKFTDLFQKYGHALLLLYMPLYFIWFNYIEQNVTSHFHVIHMWLDDKIPFCEYFVVPYIMWFPYVAVTVAVLLFKDKEEYIKLCKFLFTGMTIFLIVSSVYHNGSYLRPMTFDHYNIFIGLTQMIYSNDTPTNLFPSIHVFNSLGINIAIHRSRFFENKKKLRTASTVLCVLIILSTMFLKQHSVFDVMCGFIMAAGLYKSVYAGKELQENAYGTTAES